MQPYLKLQRAMEVAEKKQLYKWYRPDEKEENKFAGLPGFIEAADDVMKLPKDLKFENERAHDIEWTKHVKSAGSSELYYIYC